MQFFAGESTNAVTWIAAGNGPADNGEAQVTPAGKPKNPLANVAYGKQGVTDKAGASVGRDDPGAPNTRETETVVTQDSAEQRKADFESLIKGDYKDLFDGRVQSIINARFKETKNLEARVKSVDNLMQALSGKYGVSANDSEALMKAINEDNSYFEDEADKRGLTVEQLKTMRKMQAENDQLRKMMEQRQHEEFKTQLFTKWERESEQCGQSYPGFDFQRETTNPETGERFMSLLDRGIDIKTAYEVIHKDELLGGAIQYAVAETQKRTVDSIRARGMRPGENGASGNAPAQVIKNDPSKWTRADREEISRRVQRGERIEL